MSAYDPGPYGPVPQPGPTGYVGTTSVLPPRRRRPRTLVVVLVGALVVLLAAGAVAATVVVRRLVQGSPDRLVASVPADAVAYGHVSLRPSASNLVGLASLASRLEEATGEPLLDADRLASEVDDEDAPRWAEDIQPWLGTQAAFFVAPPADGQAAPPPEEDPFATGPAPDAAALVDVRDEDLARAFVEEHLDPTGAWEAGDGAQGWELDGGTVLALADDLLVVGTPAAVTAALDPAGTTLEEDEGYLALVDELPASVSTVWVDVQGASALTAGVGYLGLPTQEQALGQLDEIAFGLSLSSGAADVTTVSRPLDGGPLAEVAAADLGDLPGGGLLYLRFPDVGGSLAASLDAAGQASADTGMPSPRDQVDEALAAYGTDVDTVAGWLGDVVATGAYDPSRAADNSGVLVRAAVSDEAAATALLDAFGADLPPDSGVQVAPGSLTSGSATLAVEDGALQLRAGTLPDGTLSDDDAYAAATEGLAGETVAYLDLRSLVGAVAPLVLEGQELDADERQAVDVLAAFDRLVVTTERIEGGLDRSRVRLSWGSQLVPLDLVAAPSPPDLDLGALGALGGSGGPVTAPLMPSTDPSLDPSTDPSLGGLPVVPGGEPDAYGDDPALDALWDACAGGDGSACDDLYLSSPYGSGYEAFAMTCGGRNELEAYTSCAPPG